MNTRDDGTRTISILPWVILGLLFMFLPLSNKFFPGVDGEPAVFSAAILCTCLLVVACVAGGWKSRVGLQLVPTDLFFLLYLVYATVRWGVLAVHTLDPLVYCEWFTIVLIYLLARCLPARGFLLFLVFFGVSGLIQAVMGIGQANAWLPPGNLTFPVTGTFNNPGPFAGYLALVLVCAFSALTRSSNLPVKQNVPLLLTCLLLALALILSNSRAAWLAVVLPVGLYVGQQLPASRSRSLALKISMVVLLLLLVLFLYVYKKDSADVRLLTWRAGFSLFLDAPLWGHGVGGFASNYMNYQARFLNAHPGSHFAYLADNNTIAFNDYLRLLCEQGVVGFILFMALLLSGLFSLGRRPLSLPRMALFSLGVFGFFSYPASTFPLKVCFPLFLGMAAREQSPFRVFQCPRVRIMVLSCLLLVGLLPVFRAASLYKQARQNLLTGAYLQRDFSPGDKVYSRLSRDKAFLYLLSEQLVQARQWDAALEVKRQLSLVAPTSSLLCDMGVLCIHLDFLDKAATLFQSAREMTPNHVMPVYGLFLVARERQQHTMALQLAHEIISMPVRVVNNIVLRARHEAKKYIDNSNSQTCNDNEKTNFPRAYALSCPVLHGAS